MQFGIDAASRRLQQGMVLGVLLLLSIGMMIQAEDTLTYNEDIRPILAENCFACHGADSASREAGLRLDQRDAALEFGAITPGEPEYSEMFVRIMTEDHDLIMPPLESKKTLTAEEKAILKQWLEDGAEYQPHWSFLPPEKTEPPAATPENWAKNPIDQFISANLKEHGLKPNSEAKPRTLFRRLHLDITGLPPEPAEVAAFLKDYREHGDAALSEWIDRLMESPAWGEHRARYWLDAARYGDTHGLHFDNYREMWPYRDWVIRSFNRNQPFDQFTVEQLAGDLLPNPTTDQLIATGFQRCNITTNEGGTIDEENLANYASDRVLTFGWVYLGLTTNCSQCHDHKFDPITMKDYYSLAAFFRNTTQGPKDGNVADGRGPVLVIPTEEDTPRWEALPQEIAAAKKEQEAHKRNAKSAFEEWVQSAQANDIYKDVPSHLLYVHLPLEEGQGNEVSLAGEEPRTFKGTGDLQWVEDPQYGKVFVAKQGSTINLEDLGDFDKNQSFSFGAWIKPPKNPISGSILARMDGKAAHRGWDLWQSGNKFSVHLIDSWPRNAIKVSSRRDIAKPDRWQHLFVTYDGSENPEGVKIYLNGRLQKNQVDTNTIKPDSSIRTKTPLRIGQRSHSSVYQGGAIRDVRIYERELGPSEVLVLSGNPSLRAILARPAEKRTKEQTATLFDFYLMSEDKRYPELIEKVKQLESEQAAIRTRSPITHIQEEQENSPAMANILMRGEYDNVGEEVAAATPAALHPLPEGAPNNRLGLALWVVDPANPLTARVTVNRFWQQVFGRGIVETSEDFGVMGMLPTHPQLLDWLAVDFVESGWDVKRFFKQIFMSAAYRQSAAVTVEKIEKDRDNAWLSRGPRFRMDAEMLRDSALAAGGLLSTKMYGPGVKPYQPEAIWSIVGLPNGNTRDYLQGTGEDLYRRTVYSFWKRMAPPPNMEAFNAPSREVCTIRRERTNTPLQALVTLNDPQFVEAARHLAEQALLKAGLNQEEIINFIAKRVLSRSMTEKEQNILLTDLSDFLEYYRSNPQDAEALISVGESQPSDTPEPAVLAAWTMVCNQVMNLDEALSK
ncbi:Planctomycete cytochrome C [Planctomycetales bacterium 10988]|nr:Planctomycete cytochrome C [Planctomycetales bacterium 10988]